MFLLIIFCRWKDAKYHHGFASPYPGALLSGTRELCEWGKNQWQGQSETTTLCAQWRVLCHRSIA